VSDPVMVAMAAAVAAKAAEGVSEGARTAVAALVRLVRRRLGADPAARAALESARAEPADEARIARLAAALELAAARDRTFADELHRQWRDARAQWAVVGDVTAAGPTVLAGNIQGGVHFHQRAEGAVPIPRQPPAPPAHFVGRDAELAEVDRLLAEHGSGPAVVVITGVGGIGKSALALRWAQRAAPRFPDGQLYAHLGAFDPAGPAPPGEVLGRALRALGIAPEHVPADAAEQAAMFRSTTADRKLLLLLDNAVSAAQVRPLLPTSPACVVLVTARWRLGGLVGDGARFLPVEPLTEPAATELLTRVLGGDRTGSDPASTSSLVRLCAGLPIALTVTGARLATRPRWSIGRVVDELAQEHHRLHRLGGREDVSVQGAFDLSYQEFSAPVARCYRMLGLHPGAEFGTAVVAAALDVSEEEAAELLDVLLEASMLGETAEDRYRLHDLVRLHARQHADADPERPVLARRTAEWYLAGALAADRLLTPYRHRDPDSAFTALDAGAVVLADRDEALSWLEDERANLVATIRYAAPEQPLLAWQIADSMWPLFHYRRHHHDRMQVDRLAVECARRLRDPDREARMLRRWAFAHLDVARLDRARELFERSLGLCEELGNRYGAASAVEGLGSVALAERRYPDAAAYFDRQLRLCRELGEHRRAGLALLNLGVVGNETARPRQALTHLREAAAVFGELTDVDPYNGARVRIELGRALGRLGEHRPAREELTRALADMRLGELALTNGEFAEARAHLDRALRIYERLGDVETGQVRHLAGLIPPAEADPHRVP
jgi:tetratricopeptide (TPR) repeat protein